MGPTVRLLDVEYFERDIRLRMPFRFGVVTMTAAPQAAAGGETGCRQSGVAASGRQSCTADWTVIGIGRA